MSWTPKSVWRLLLRRTVQGIEDIARIALGFTPQIAARTNFANAYERLRQVSAATRLRVLGDLRATIWADRVQNFLASRDINSVMECSGPWECYLQDFGRFAVAASFLEGLSFNSTCSVHDDQGLILPGTGLCLSLPRDSDSTVEISVDAAGHFGAEGTSITPVDRLAAAGFELANEESDLIPLHLPGYTPLPRNEIDLNAWAISLKGAKSLLALHLPSAELSEMFAPTIILIRQSSDGAHLSVSFQNYPRVVYLSWSPRPHELAEALVHEADHQMMYGLARFIRFWKGRATEQAALYRSPWRPDPRPVDGLLFGASAFTRVGIFWQTLMDKPCNVEEDPDWLGTEAVLVLRQSLDAVDQIRRHAEMTEDGMAIVDSVEQDARSCLNVLSRKPSFECWDTTAHARETAHNSAWLGRFGHPDCIGAQ